MIVIAFCFFATGCASSKKDDLLDLSQNFSNYYLDIEYQDGNIIALEEIDYVNNSEAMLKDVKLHLYVASFCKNAKNSPVNPLNSQSAYYDGENFASLNIGRIQLDGKDVGASYEGEDNEIMVVNLIKSLYPSERVSIKIEFILSLPKINHRLGITSNAINVCNFYPIVCNYEHGYKCDPYSNIGDPFCSDTANYYVNMKTPSKYTLATSGEIKTSTNLDNFNFYNIEALCVRDFAFVLSENFKQKTKDFKGIKLNYYYLDDKNADRTMLCIENAIDTFSSMFYNYPYPSYSVVETDFCYGGMEYPNLSLVSNQIENYDDFLHVIVHETAHQWWYNLVGNDEYNESWLDESLTEYSSILFYDNNKGYNYEHSKMITSAHDNYLLYNNVFKDVLGKVDSSMERPLCEFDSEPEYTYTIYVKGVLMFDSLYNLVGKTKFVKALQNYAENNAYKIAHKENLIASFEHICKTNLENFFDCWLSGKVIIN